MIAARADLSFLSAPFSSSGEGLFTPPGSATPATDSSEAIPSAPSNTHAVHSPFGASEKIFAPHLRQVLITLIIARESACVLILVLRRILSKITPVLKT